ncbi:MAG: DUF255 domain-containing protein [Alphaproteobacteria bacterium]|jgi:uncharacterized protein YyaL (SSP411 family)|nr:DUF255 domain-containing protein [Alphaproteobacteria bacterium]
MPRNQLAQETSPYLLQHADNPVQWMAWGEDAFRKARTESKPVLLSIGYAACHWCHVMAHESFEDDGIAGLMNDLFVNIKVDREERPDVDQVYQTALALMGQQGGWPLTMFLTPEGAPFWGGTYFPASPRYGRPGFGDVLQAIAATYRQEPDKVSQNVDALRDALTKVGTNTPGQPVPRDRLDDIAGHLVRQVDPQHGGVGGPPKFPQPSLLHMLWRAWRRTGAEPFRDAVTLTLTRMAQGGIYDHLGGGFARYSVDGEWLVPHFEKMLYDNAQLIELMTLVWQQTRTRLFETRVRESVGWVLREMIAEGGGFAATLDADSEGEEGKFYVWSAEEIDRILGEDATLFKLTYDVGKGGNWEGKTILNRRRQDDLADPETEAKLAEMRARLLAERVKRIWPGWDDKVLADWNGLMIAALAEASAVFAEPDWLAAARRAFDFVAGEMAEGDRLWHSRRQGKVRHAGMLDDYAQMARAALALYEATGEAGYLGHAERWVGTLDGHFWDAESGGYFLAAADADDLFVRSKTIHDNATPAGNGTMVGVLARLAMLTGKELYQERAEALLAAFSGETERAWPAMASFFNGSELLRAPLQIAIIGEAAAPETAALRRAVFDRSLPDRVLAVLPPDAALPTGHPAAGKGTVEGKPTAYVCPGQTCLQPVTDADALGAQLDGL